jgi:uncharacterized sulfatase
MAFLSDKTGTDAEHTDGKVATQTIELLERHNDKPFFIACGFYKPHCPWITPSKYFDMYSMDEISLPKISDETPKDYPPPALQSTRPWPYYGVTPEQARECKRAYFAAISFVDAQVGRVIDAVDRLGLADNTIIVFWSDHGYHLGEHGLWFKLSCFEESARVPVIIVTPHMKNAGKVSLRLVELLDLYPTLADLTGLAPPTNLEGVSLRPLLDNPGQQWDRPAYTQVQRGDGRGNLEGGFAGHSVRTDRWRYTEWDFGARGQELYDQELDPQEVKNLANDAEHAEVVKEMKALLKKVHLTRVDGGVAEPGTKKKYCD